MPLALKLREAAEAGQTDLAEALGRQVAVLQRCAAAPDVGMIDDPNSKAKGPTAEEELAAAIAAAKALEAK